MCDHSSTTLSDIDSLKSLCCSEMFTDDMYAGHHTDQPGGEGFQCLPHWWLCSLQRAAKSYLGFLNRPWQVSATMSVSVSLSIKAWLSQFASYDYTDLKPSIICSNTELTYHRDFQKDPCAVTFLCAWIPVDCHSRRKTWSSILFWWWSLACISL